MSATRKVISLNIEGEKHLHRFLSFVREEKADIVFLQETPQHLVEKIGKQLSLRPIRFDAMSYAPRPYRGQDSHTSIWGMACYVREGISVLSADAEDYRRECLWGNPGVRTYDGQADRMIQSIVIAGDVSPCILLQTHFTWTHDGFPDERQEKDIEIVLGKLRVIPQFALFGDFNVPRSRNNIWDRVSAEYKDNIPHEVSTTLDEQLHRVGHLPRLVDMCFTTPSHQVDTIRIVPGLSDHKAIIAQLIVP